MGILIREEYDNAWIIEIREEWLVDTIKEAEGLAKDLFQRGIEFRISYSFELIHFHFENAKTMGDYDHIRALLDLLLEYKNKYGHKSEVKKDER